MELKRIGHVLLRVRDLERSRAFYTGVLGLEVMEQDPEHGGLFMALPGHAHTLDLFPASDPDGAAPPMTGGLGVQHVAFQVDSEEALRAAYFSLVDHGVKIARAVDHVSQKSLWPGLPLSTLGGRRPSTSDAIDWRSSPSRPTRAPPRPATLHARTDAPPGSGGLSTRRDPVGQHAQLASRNIASYPMILMTLFHE